VRFIQLYHPGWDHHGNLPSGIRRQCQDIDRACFALVADLKTPEAALPIRVRVENPQAESAPGPSAASCSTFAT